MRGPIYLGLFFLVFGCKKAVDKKDLGLLNGYWEIKKVTFPDGNSKDYNVNTNIDYVEVDGIEGFKKKVQPKLDGTFETSNDAEFFTIAETENGLALNYKNALSEWREELIMLSDFRFSVKNEEGFIYEYQRFEPINLKN